MQYTGITKARKVMAQESVCKMINHFAQQAFSGLPELQLCTEHNLDAELFSHLQKEAPSYFLDVSSVPVEQLDGFFEALIDKIDHSGIDSSRFIPTYSVPENKFIFSLHNVTPQIGNRADEALKKKFQSHAL